MLLWLRIVFGPLSRNRLGKPGTAVPRSAAAVSYTHLDVYKRQGFTHVRLAITITGPETQERYTELRDVVDQHCPVLDLFVNATPVSATVTKG